MSQVVFESRGKWSLVASLAFASACGVSDNESPSSVNHALVGEGDLSPGDSEPQMDACGSVSPPMLRLLSFDKLDSLSSGDVLPIELSRQGGFHYILKARGEGFPGIDVAPLHFETTLTVGDVMTHERIAEFSSIECTDDGELEVEFHVGANTDIVRTPEEVAQYDGREAVLWVEVRSEAGVVVDAQVSVTLQL